VSQKSQFTTYSESGRMFVFVPQLRKTTIDFRTWTRMSERSRSLFIRSSFAKCSPSHCNPALKEESEEVSEYSRLSFFSYTILQYNICDGNHSPILYSF